MAHVRQQIRDEVVTVLTGLTTTGANVYAGRDLPINDTLIPALCIYTRADTPDYEAGVLGCMPVRRLELVVEGYSKASTDDELDTIAAEVETAIYTDPTLNSLAHALELGEQTIETDDSPEKTVGVIRMVFYVEYRVAEGVPTQADTPATMSSPVPTQGEIMRRSYGNPYKFILLFEDFNVMPYYETGLLTSTVPHGWLIRGTNVPADAMGLPVVGQSSLPSSAWLRTGTASGDNSYLSAASRHLYAPTWQARLKGEWVLAWKGSGWGYPSASTGHAYMVGFGSAGVAAVPDPATAVNPRFESVDGETMKLRYNTAAGAQEIDTGITSGIWSGDVQSGETLEHEFLAHCYNGAVYCYADGALVGTGPDFQSTVDAALYACVKKTDATLAGARELGIDYLFSAVERTPQTADGP